MKFEELIPFRTRSRFDIEQVPRYLFEQIGDADSEAVKAIYDNAETIAGSDAIWFVLFLSNEKKIKGVLWFNIDLIEHRIFVHLFSVDPEYQSCDMNLAQWVGGYIFNNEKIDEKFRNKISFLTSRPEIYEKFGLKRSKRVMMEISREDYERQVDIRGKSFVCS